MGQDTAKPARQTWREWVPEARETQLLTRADLLAAAERLGLFADQRNPDRALRYWESLGVLPSAVLEGPRGRERALYPRWFLDLIYQLKRYQDQGFSLAELPLRMRAAARSLARLEFHWPVWQENPELEAEAPHFYAYMRDHWPYPKLWSPVDLTTSRVQLSLPDFFVRDLRRLAGIVSDLQGVPAATVELRVLDAHGRALETYSVPAEGDAAHAGDGGTSEAPGTAGVGGAVGT